MYYFFVKTGYLDNIGTISDEDNEIISSKSVYDHYESYELDFVGLYYKNASGKIDFSFRSPKMLKKYENMNFPFEIMSDNFLVFASFHGSLDHVNNYAANMNFCRVFIGEIFVDNYKKIEDSDYIMLEFGTEGG